MAKKSDDGPGLFESGAARSAASVAGPPLPEGFRYEQQILTADEERDVVRHLETLPFKGFEFQGFVGNRRVVSYGWKYDFNDRQLQKADDMPAFLAPLRGRVAAWAGLAPSAFQHALVTEYAPGAGIGW